MSLFEDTLFVFKNKYDNIDADYIEKTFLYYARGNNCSFPVVFRWDGENIIITAHKEEVPGIFQEKLNDLINLINCQLTLGNFQLSENTLVFRVSLFNSNDFPEVEELKKYSNTVEHVFDFYYPCFQGVVFGLPPSLALGLSGDNRSKNKNDDYDILNEIEKFLEKWE